MVGSTPQDCVQLLVMQITQYGNNRELLTGSEIVRDDAIGWTSNVPTTEARAGNTEPLACYGSSHSPGSLARGCLMGHLHVILNPQTWPTRVWSVLNA